MAVRIRIVDGKMIALCAAEHQAQEGDIYLDDVQDHALRKKYLEDYREEGLIVGEKEEEVNGRMVRIMKGKDYEIWERGDFWFLRSLHGSPERPKWSNLVTQSIPNVLKVEEKDLEKWRGESL